MSNPRAWRVALRRGGRRSLAVLVILAGVFAGAASARSATIQVDSSFDLLDPADGLCTLREAISAANDGQPSGPGAGECPAGDPGEDTIVLPPGTYRLAIPGADEDLNQTGSLDILDGLRLLGAGRTVTTIDAAGLDRVLMIASPGAGVLLSAVTVTGGVDPGLRGGGGILIAGSGPLTLADGAVSGNRTDSTPGGGIRNESGALLRVERSLVENNSATACGGLDSRSGPLLVVDSLIRGNTARLSGGGGLCQFDAAGLSLLSSTVSGNTALICGGVDEEAGPALLVNSTLSGNRANFVTGGLCAPDAGSVTRIFSSTIAANTAFSDVGGLSGLHVELTNTLVAGNLAEGLPDDCGTSPGILSLGHNLTGQGGGCPTGAAGDVTVSPSSVFTLVLGPLQDNGGPTPTRALRDSSPAIDQGDPAGCQDGDGVVLATDQRGRPRLRDGDGDGTAVCDIGAFEVGPAGAPPTANAGSDRTLECTGPDGAVAILDGTLSSDPDSTPGTNDDIVAYQWIEDRGLPSETLLGGGAVLEMPLPLGDHLITLRVTDSTGQVDEDTVAIAIVDLTPPEITVTVTPNVLRPPDHRMVEVSATVEAHDTCGEVTVELTSIVSNEPEDLAAGGDIQQADIGTADFVFLLRAERLGSGEGRQYVVTYTATDESNNQTSASATVLVPKGSKSGRTGALRPRQVRGGVQGRPDMR